jgi:hypothetical protein
MSPDPVWRLLYMRLASVVAISTSSAGVDSHPNVPVSSTLRQPRGKVPYEPVGTSLMSMYQYGSPDVRPLTGASRKSASVPGV